MEIMLEILQLFRSFKLGSKKIKVEKSKVEQNSKQTNFWVQKIFGRKKFWLKNLAEKTEVKKFC